MFFVALSNGVWFEGKIGIWLIVEVVTAQRASKSRARGDSVLRPVTVDGEKYKKIMIDEVIPGIKAKMPTPPGHTIFVQQDGAKPHTNEGVMEAIHHTRDPAFQLSRTQRERSWFLPLHPAAGGGRGIDHC
ncbi:unnamed protein product [Discosporangium mesarthrocarpum]